MTKFYLIRHGEPDYNDLSKHNIKDTNLARLSIVGKRQAEVASKSELIKNADLVIASPIARAFQTGSIISNRLGLDLELEPGLHEWASDLEINTGVFSKFRAAKLYEKAQLDYINKTKLLDDVEIESLDKTKHRALKVLEQYTMYDEVIVATHSGVIFALTKKEANYCDIYEQEYTGRKVERKMRRLKKTTNI